MTNLLRSLYSRLPIVRELRNLNVRCRVLREQLDAVSLLNGRLLQERAVRYEERLLMGDRYLDPRNLGRFDRHVFSQFGQDGILAEIVRRIGEGNRTFVEIGVGTGIENNTAYLLLQGWKGCWVEGNPVSVELIRRRCRAPIQDGRLRISETMVTAENVATTLENLGVAKEVDIFSLDVDRNTYWVWAALTSFRPRIAVIEYNGHFPPDIDWKVDYDPNATWNGSIYYGASLKALEVLGRRLGYSLVACNVAGVDAFFVRDDLCGDLFERPFTAEKHHEPFRQFLERSRGFRPCLNDLAEGLAKTR